MYNLDISSLYPPMRFITSHPKLLCPICYPLPVCLNDPSTFLIPFPDPHLFRAFQHSRYCPFQPIPCVVILLPCPPFHIPPEILDPIALTMKLRKKQHQVPSFQYFLFQHSFLRLKIFLVGHQPPRTAIPNALPTTAPRMFFAFCVLPFLLALQL